MSLNKINYSGQYLDDKYFKIKIATGGDIYKAAEAAVAGEMFLVTGAQPALYAAKSTSTFSDGIADYDIYKVKDLTNVPKIKHVSLMEFPGNITSDSEDFLNNYNLNLDEGDYIDIGDITSLNSASNASYSFWYKTDSAGKVILIGDASKGLSVYHYFDGNMYIHSFMDARSHAIPIPKLGVWHHIACTFEASGSKMYLDGILQSTVDHGDTTDATCGNNFSIGKLTGYQDDTTGGKRMISEVALFASTLSDLDVSTIYNNGPQTSLASYSPVSYFSRKKSSVYSLELDDTSISLASDISFTGPFTISAWVKPDQTSLGMPFGQYSASNFVLRYANSAFAFWVNGTDHVNGTASFPNDSWYHVMVVRDSSDLITLYVNGASDASFTHSGTLTTTGLTSSTYKYIGLSDEYAIWDSDQSANIAEIYNNGIPGNLDPLAPLGWWRMGDDDSGSGTTITDQGSGANNATIVGNAIFSQETPE
jgi:hypothetical protein